MYTNDGQRPQGGESIGTQVVSRNQLQSSSNGTSNGYMSENRVDPSAPEPIENPPISITLDDISEANQLSLACPICASPVEAYSTQRALAPVVCTDCGTLYHLTCWEQNGGKCAVIGCESKTYTPYGSEVGATLTITTQDIMRTPQRYRDNTAKYKQNQRGRTTQPSQGQGFWTTLFNRIRRAFENIG